MKTMNEHGIIFLIATCLLNGAVHAKSCEEEGKPADQTLQVCHENVLTTNNVYIDSGGAPNGDDIVCWCYIYTMNNPYPLNITVRSDSSRSKLDWNGVVFTIQRQRYSFLNSDTVAQVEVNYITSIMFSRRGADTGSSVCLSLMAEVYAVQMKVRCRKYTGSGNVNGMAEKGSSHAFWIVIAVVASALIVASVVGVLVKKYKQQGCQQIHLTPPSIHSGQIRRRGQNRFYRRFTRSTSTNSTVTNHRVTDGQDNNAASRIETPC